MLFAACVYMVEWLLYFCVFRNSFSDFRVQVQMMVLNVDGNDGMLMCVLPAIAKTSYFSNSSMYCNDSDGELVIYAKHYHVSLL